jgi:hypothetical protein
VFRSGASATCQPCLFFIITHTFSIAARASRYRKTQQREHQMKLFPMNIKQTTPVFIVFIDLFLRSSSLLLHTF